MVTLQRAEPSKQRWSSQMASGNTEIKSSLAALLEAHAEREGCIVFFFKIVDVEIDIIL